jgi:hypothetical protein
MSLEDAILVHAKALNTLAEAIIQAAGTRNLPTASEVIPAEVITGKSATKSAEKVKEKPAEVKEEPKAEVAEIKEEVAEIKEEVKDTSVTVTFGELKEVFLNACGVDEDGAVGVLKHYKAEKLSAIGEANYAEAFKKLKDLTKE